MNRTNPDYWLAADWPVSDKIVAGTSLLAADQATGGDRSLLKEILSLPDEPVWIQQEHGNHVHTITDARHVDIVADAATTSMRNTVCAVVTADCMPILLCNKNATRIAATHAGWRGLCKDIINETLACFTQPAAEIFAWFGPFIHQQHYEVGAEVLEQCESICTNLSEFVRPSRTDHAWLDLGGLAKWQLKQAGVEQIFDCDLCTFEQEQLCYSYRRAKKNWQNDQSDMD